MSVIQKRVQSALQPAWASDIVLGGQEGGEGLGSLRGRRGGSGLGLSAVCLDLAGSLRHVCLWLCCGPRGPHGVKPGGSGYRWRHVFLRYINKHRKKKKNKLLQVIQPTFSNRLEYEGLHLNGYIYPYLYVQATDAHRKMWTERYMFLCGEKGLCALLLTWTNAGGRLRQRWEAGTAGLFVKLNMG